MKTTTERSPWVIGLIIGFILVAIVNVIFIWVAVRGQDTVVESYHTTSR